MKITSKIIFLWCFLYASSVFAYGGGGGTKTACKKPQFSAISPTHLAEVAAESVIKFKASLRTDPDSIIVTAKRELLALEISKNNNSYVVTGKLPTNLQETFARMVIKAKSTSGCEAKEAWLLKISAQNGS